MEGESGLRDLFSGLNYLNCPERTNISDDIGLWELELNKMSINSREQQQVVFSLVVLMVAISFFLPAWQWLLSADRVKICLYKHFLNDKYKCTAQYSNLQCL